MTVTSFHIALFSFSFHSLLHFLPSFSISLFHPFFLYNQNQPPRAHECALFHADILQHYTHTHSKPEEKKQAFSQLLVRLSLFSRLFLKFWLTGYAQINTVNHMSQPKRRVVTVPARALQAHAAAGNRNSRITHRAAQAGQSRVQALLQNLGKINSTNVWFLKTPIENAYFREKR